MSDRDPFRGPSRKPPKELRDSSGFLSAAAEIAWQSGDVGGVRVESPLQAERAKARGSRGTSAEERTEAKQTQPGLNPPPVPSTV